MRLRNVQSGHSPLAKVKLGLFRVMSGRPPPDVVRVLMYRPEYFGAHFSELVHEVLRGPSDWTPCERELFASFTARLGDCEF